MSSANKYSGFGFPEPPTAVEFCDVDGCSRNSKPSVTDLFCRHGQFLPFIWIPTAGRLTLVIFLTLIIYGAFEWTAQTDSATPVYIAYSAIFLGFVNLPLRHFTRTARITAFIWLAATFVAIFWHFSPTGFWGIAVTEAMIGGIVLHSVNQMLFIRQSRPSLGYWRLAGTVAATWIVAAWSAFAAFLLYCSAYVLPESNSTEFRVMLIIAGAWLTTGALIAIASSTVLGVGNVETDSLAIPRPSSPTWSMPNLPSPPSDTPHSRNAVDLMTATFIHTMQLIAFFTWNVLLTVAQVIAYCIKLVIYAATWTIVSAANLIIHFIVLVARWAWASLKTSAQICRDAATLTFRGIFASIVSVLVPVAALLATPWLLLATADQSQHYLRDGSLTSLGEIIFLLLTASGLLLGTWIIVANQHLRESFRSAGRSIPGAVGVTIAILFFGGWLLGILGELGYGHIRLGLIT